MASTSTVVWTLTTLTQAFDQFFQQKSINQMGFTIEEDTLDNTFDIHIDGDHWLNSYKLPKNDNNRKILGNTILALSKMGKYDRIINLKIAGESPKILDFMKPLLSDDFNSLISLTELGGIAGKGYHFGGISYKATYDTLCEMISHDKMIVIVLGFNSSHLVSASYAWNNRTKTEIYDYQNKKFIIDESKLLNAIKSTNSLKDILLPPPNSLSTGFSCNCDPNMCAVHCNPQIDYDLHDLLKEALSLNFSVTTITALTSYGRGIDIIANCQVGKTNGLEAIIAQKLLSKYESWWPLIKKRNEESQKFNKILVGDQKDDGTWNSSKCPHTIAQKLLKIHFPKLLPISFDKKGDRCFCLKCHKLRKDKLIYKRGKPPKRYALPIGWVRFGLKTDQSKCLYNNVWEEWHVAFHGTTKDIVPQIFKAGLQLLKPGDVTIDGKQLGITDGHIQKPFKRINKYTKQQEIFDPNQIYMSPSIKYSGHGAYAKWFYCSHPDNNNKTVKVQCAFQLRVKPNAYGIGQETVGAAIVWCQ